MVLALNIALVHSGVTLREELYIALFCLLLPRTGHEGMRGILNDNLTIVVVLSRCRHELLTKVVEFLPLDGATDVQAIVVVLLL